jgi:TonB family protein
VIEFPPPQDGIAAIRDVETQLPSAPPQPPTPRPSLNRIVGGPGAGFPDTDDFYPDAARALGEQGVVTIHVCVDSAGRLSADPSVVVSSGSARLDQGALRLAQAGSGHYRATTEDGRPVSSCYPFRVRFHFKDRMR